MLEELFRTKCLVSGWALWGVLRKLSQLEPSLE